MITCPAATEPDFTEFVTHVEGVAQELYPDKDWSQDSSGFDFMENILLEEVYSTAYERAPHKFENINWINDAYGMPLWVRPGVQWTADSLDDDYDDDSW
jgi:hypothetical protein